MGCLSGSSKTRTRVCLVRFQNCSHILYDTERAERALDPTATRRHSSTCPPPSCLRFWTLRCRKQTSEPARPVTAVFTKRDPRHKESQHCAKHHNQCGVELGFRNTSRAGLIICKTPHLLAIDRYDACEERSIYVRNATVYGCPQSSDVWLCVTKLTASSFCWHDPKWHSSSVLHWVPVSALIGTGSSE